MPLLFLTSKNMKPTNAEILAKHRLQTERRRADQTLYQKFLEAVLRNGEALHTLKILAVKLNQYEFATTLRKMELELYPEPKSERPWEEYLTVLGEMVVDYKYTVEELFENINYFKKCWKDNTSCYRAIEMFHFHLEDKNEIKG
jgi:hypothetical protein